jgi:hypothetical protein
VKNLKFISLSLIAAALFTVSCTKTGAKGDTGATGATGAAGPDSVYYSAPITLSSTQTIDSSGNTVFVDTISAPELTASLVNTSTLEGYLDYPTGFGDSSYIPAGYLNLEQFPEVGKIVLEAGGSFSGWIYRYVIIPGGVSISSANGKTVISPAALARMDYNTLMADLGVPVSSGKGAIKVTSVH